MHTHTRYTHTHPTEKTTADVQTREGSSTEVLVLNFTLRTFSEALDGAFKHLIS